MLRAFCMHRIQASECTCICMYVYISVLHAPHSSKRMYMHMYVRVYKRFACNAFKNASQHPAARLHTGLYLCAQFSAARLAYRGQRPGSGSNRRRRRTSHSRRRRRGQPHRAWSAPSTRMRAHTNTRAAQRKGTRQAQTHTPCYGRELAVQQACAQAFQRPARSARAHDASTQTKPKATTAHPRRRPLPPARPAAPTPSSPSARPHDSARHLVPHRAAAPIQSRPARPGQRRTPGHGAPAAPPRAPHAPSGRARADTDGCARQHTPPPLPPPARAPPRTPCYRRLARLPAHRCCVREDRELAGQR